MTDPQHQIEMDVRAGNRAVGWHPEHVKAAIRARGCTLAQFGERNGCTGSMIRKAIVTPCSRRLEQAIARFLGVPAADIWPSRYARRSKMPRRGFRLLRGAK